MSTPPQNIQAIGLQDVLGLLRRGVVYAGILAAVAAGAAFVVARQTAPVYRGTVVLLASQSTSGYAGLGLVAPPPVDPSVYQTAVLEGPVAKEALTSLLGRAPSPQRLAGFVQDIHVAVQKQDVSSVLRIGVDSTDPAFAARAANAVANALVDWDIDRARQTVARTVDALRRSIADIDAQLAGGTEAQPLSTERKQALSALRQQRVRELDAAQAADASSVTVGRLEPLAAAATPTHPVGPSLSFTVLVAAVLGAALGYGLLFLRWALDPNVRGRDEAAALTGLPILAEFPPPSRGDRRASVEAANFLRSSLVASWKGDQAQVLAITSPRSGREKEGVSASLASSLARAGYCTLLVDGDLRHGSATYGLDISKVSTPPLEVYLESSSVDFTPAVVNVAGKHSFDFVPSFTEAAYPVELLNRGLGRWLEKWRSSYDCVVLDCPPVLPFADALAIARLCSGTVLCSSSTGSRRRDLADAVDLLRRDPLRVLGLTLTNVQGRRSRRRAARHRTRAAAEPASPYRTLGQGATNVQVKGR